jgi:hypothetical protein
MARLGIVVARLERALQQCNIPVQADLEGFRV